MSSTLDTLSNNTMNVVFDTLSLQACGRLLLRAIEQSSDRNLRSPHGCCADRLKEAFPLSPRVCVL